MTEAIRFVLERRGFKAGRYTVGYQSCDDSTAQAGVDLYKCFSNAKAYARTSPCSASSAPHSGCATSRSRLRTRPRGPLAMSARRTRHPLTRPPGCARGARGRYPSGERNFVRIAAADHLQAVAGAQLVEGWARGAYSFSRTPTSADVATAARNSSSRSAPPGGPRGQVDARPTHRRAAPTRSPRRLPLSNGGPWFGTPRPPRSTWRSSPPTARRDLIEAGPAARGCTSASTACRTPSSTRASSSRGVRSHRAASRPVSAAYAAQAAEILLDAIARSDGTRSSVRESFTGRRSRTASSGHPLRRVRRPRGGAVHHLPRRRQGPRAFEPGAVVDRVITPARISSSGIPASIQSLKRWTRSSGHGSSHGIEPSARRS